VEILLSGMNYVKLEGAALGGSKTASLNLIFTSPSDVISVILANRGDLS
jgi:hypothetical protein